MPAPIMRPAFTEWSLCDDCECDGKWCTRCSGTGEVCAGECGVNPCECDAIALRKAEEDAAELERSLREMPLFDELPI